MCRSGTLKLAGFPNFQNVVQEMQQKKEANLPEYEVSVSIGNGHLAIKQNLIDYWLKCEYFKDDIMLVVKEHNDKYNPHGIKRGCDAIKVEAGDGAEEQPAKRIRIESSVKLAEEAKFGDKLLSFKAHVGVCWV